MKSRVLAIIVGIIPFWAAAQSSQTKYITINNIQTAYKSSGLESRPENKPVVIFESGIGMGGGNFDTVFPHLPNDIAYFVYDRNGIGESQTDSSLKSDADVVDKLHLILEKLNIKPPYLLVGHSLGGAFIRLFESRFPKEVSGMVFIDPTDFMLTKEENESARKKSGSKIGYRELWPAMLSDMANDGNMPQGVRLEMQRELNSSRPDFFKEYQNLRPLSNIPTAVLIAYNRHIERFEEQTNAKLGINGRLWFDEFDQYRIAHFSKIIGSNKNSFIMLLPQYSHGIHNQDPELVADVISRIYRKG